jgi:hypothetical protein
MCKCTWPCPRRGLDIQTKQLTLFPSRLRDSGEIGEFVVNIIRLGATGARSCRVRHVIGACLADDGSIENEASVHVWIDVHMILWIYARMYVA